MKKYILGNWKQNGDMQRVTEMVAALKKLPKQTEKIVAFFPPDVYLSIAQKLLPETNQMKLGGQNLSRYANGAYTGEISGTMLKQVGASFVLVGHSERRQLFSEKNAIVSEKFQHALSSGLTPVLCIGETLQEYEAGETTAVIQKQLEAVFDQDAYSTQEWIIAYEPIWAIGTGKVATKEEAQNVHASIRAWFKKTLSKERAQTIPIIYGGSVKPENVSGLLSMPDINGVLVGAASLDPEAFSFIAQA